jgi:uncharacterized protein YxeA
MHTKKIYGIVGIVIFIIILLAIAVYTKKLRLQSPFIIIPQSGQVFTNTKFQAVQGKDNNGLFNNLQEISDGTATEQVSYQQTVQLYKNRYVQFDPNCRVAPVTLTVPPKSVVMLDNQSKWQRSVIVGPYHYTILPYTYILSSFDIPEVYGISCDSVQDVGIINVQ